MRSHPTNIIDAMLEMLTLFDGLVEDRTTLQQLVEMASNREEWKAGHELFQVIRQKTLKAEKHQDRLAGVQYAFEEICAKALYNLSDSSAPFDADSAFWVIPLGIALGRELGLRDPAQVLSLLKM